MTGQRYGRYLGQKGQLCYNIGLKDVFCLKLRQINLFLWKNKTHEKYNSTI